MQIIITGRGVDLTDAIESYVTKKINGLEKFFDSIIRADVALGKLSNHHKKGDVFFAECKLEVPGESLFAKKEASSAYEAVDVLRDHLEAELKKRKTKLAVHRKERQRSGRDNKEYNAANE
jgi:putative sigma-54 modulation protein